jgi:hypothetical protein
VDQLLTGYPVVVGIQVVGVRTVLRKFPLRFSVGGEVSTIQVSATLSTTAAGAIGIGLAGHPVSILVKVVGIARVALELRLGFLLGGEVGAVEILRGSWSLVGRRTGALAPYASRAHHCVVPGGVEARIGL